MPKKTGRVQNPPDRKTPALVLGKGLNRVGTYETKDFYSAQLAFLNRLRNRMSKQSLISNFGITQIEWRILIHLEYRSPSKISDIYTRSLIPKPQLSSAIPRLIRQGYAVRIDDPDDARAPYFAITQKGLNLYDKAAEFSRRRQRRFEALLTKGERAGFESALKKLVDFHVATALTNEDTLDDDE